MSCKSCRKQRCASHSARMTSGPPPMNEVAGRLTHTGLLGLQDSLVTASLIRLKPEHLRPALSTHLNHESGILGLKGRWALAARRMRVRRASGRRLCSGCWPCHERRGCRRARQGGRKQGTWAKQTEESVSTYFA